MSRPNVPGQDSPDVIVLEPMRRFASLNLAQLWAHRELIYFFVWRDLKVRYKQSVIGAAWAAIQPLSLMIVFTLFFGRLAKIPSDGLPLPLFYLCGLVPWTYFSLAVISATNSLVDNRAIITKVYFPRIVFPVATTLSHLADLFVGIVLLIAMALAYGVIPGLRVLTLPFFVVLEILTVLTLGIWFSGLNARYRDVRYIVTFLVYTWMFASPVAYPSSLLPEGWRFLYSLNPMTAVIDGFRWSITGAGRGPGLATALSAIAVCLLAVAGISYFRRNETHIVDVV